MGRLLRHRDARIYLCGQTLSTIGDNALWLAMGIWVKILTHSNSAAGLVFFFVVAGVSLAPVAGMIVDRTRRRPLAAGTNLAAAVLVCALLLVHGRGQVWLIYLVMFGYGAVAALLTSAQTALVPSLVPADLLGEANTMLQVGSQGMRIFTPLLGAGLLAWVGAAPVILLDAATFVIAGGCLLALSLREQRPVPSGSSWRKDLTAGIRYTWGTRVLRKMLVTTVLALTVIGFMETIGFAIVSEGLHRRPTFLGVLVAVQAAGAIAGAVVVPAIMKRIGEVRTIAAGIVLIGAGSLLMIPASLPVVLAGIVLFGASIMFANVAAITLIQRRTKPELIGRVDAALTFASTGPQTVSIAVGAALIAVVSYRLLLAAIAAMMVVACAYWLTGQDRDAAEAPGGDQPAAPQESALASAAAGQTPA
jgi:Na+/melibiose symporter-like transporter